MPKLSGEKLIEKVRHHEKLKNTKIVVLTGNPEAEKAQKANLLGIDAMLSKPTSKKEIQRVLTMLLSSKSVGLTQEVMPNSTFSKLLGQVRLSSRGSVNLKDSGDMLFEFKRTDEHFLILVDVMGHGEKASLIRDKLSGFFSGVITANITSPAAIMEVFSNALFEDLIAGETIIPCVICKIRHRSVEWVAAGHPAPILLSHSREAHLSEEVQALPGMHNAQLYQNYKFSLCDNQRLLLVTDGIFENQSRTNENASTIVEHVAHCENCQSQLRATNTLDSDNNLLNCIWRNSLPLLSKEIDDASLVLLS
jgi:sigma-B regulation protein RsbU (phosphoserine phosphatase)